MRQIDRSFQSILFISRWLIAPFLIGLVGCLLLLIYRFFADFYALVIILPTLSWHDLIVDVLNLVDLRSPPILSSLSSFPASRISSIKSVKMNNRPGRRV